MKQQDILSLAAAYLSEELTAADTADLRRRMPQILAAAIVALEPLDREVSAEPCKNYPPYSELCDMEADFPLHERLCAVCALRVAAHLILDENPTLSARLLNAYEAARDEVVRSLPAHIAPITDKYGRGRHGLWRKHKRPLP